MLRECTLPLERKRKVQGAGRDRGDRRGEEGRGSKRRGQEETGGAGRDTGLTHRSR